MLRDGRQSATVSLLKRVEGRTVPCSRITRRISSSPAFNNPSVSNGVEPVSNFVKQYTQTVNVGAACRRPHW